MFLLFMHYPVIIKSYYYYVIIELLGIAYTRGGGTRYLGGALQKFFNTKKQERGNETWEGEGWIFHFS